MLCVGFIIFFFLLCLQFEGIQLQIKNWEGVERAAWANLNSIKHFQQFVRTAFSTLGRSQRGDWGINPPPPEIKYKTFILIKQPSD